MKARVINGQYQGTYSNDFIQKNYNKVINSQLVSEWELTDVLPNQNLLKPTWNDIEWIESATPEEIAEEKKPIYLERLQDYSTDLLIRAKGAAIGKKGDKDYILGQVEMYDNKYAFSKGVFFSQLIFDEMTKEAIEFGNTIGVSMDLEAFKQLVIYMHDDASEKYRVFVYMIERCRTFIQTLIENNDFTKVDSAFALIDTLDAPEQAQSLMASILEL